jgi:hypothetical protein
MNAISFHRLAHVDPVATAPGTDTRLDPVATAPGTDTLSEEISQ